MGFVTDAGWIDGNAMDGMRACLKDEFSSLYIFHLRGNARTSGERRRKEKGNVFGGGSRSPIAISILVNNPNSDVSGQINFHDIGDYLTEQEKLDTIRGFGSIGGISDKSGWESILPNAQHDWIDQRDDTFAAFIKSGDKKSADVTLFETYSTGIKSNRDDWVYNFSPSDLEENVCRMFDTFSNEQHRLSGLPKEEIAEKIVRDSQKIKWTTDVIADLGKGASFSFNMDKVENAVYRPFQKMWWYSDSNWNWTRHLMPSFFPNSDLENFTICVSGVGAGKGFSSLMVSGVPNLHTIDTGQCFPLRLYEAEGEQKDTDLFTSDNVICGYRVRDGITDAGLKHFQAAYPGEEISKEDIFYYVYGLLHSEEYRARYADNLTKELPRIPCVKKAEDFWAFSRAGRALGDLHVDYESVEPYPVTYKQGDPLTWVIDDPEAFYRVAKMKYKGKRGDQDKSTVIYNANITMENVPHEAYDYVVNGKSALDWVIERQVVKTDKKSGITNDANRYANETVGNPAYPLELFQRVITVSLETMKIVRGLPKLDIDRTKKDF